MAVEIIPKKPEKKALGFGDILFYVSIGLMVLAVGGYLLLLRSEKTTKEEIEATKLALESKKTEEIINLEKEILGIQGRINDFGFLAQSHIRSSKVFKYLEETIHPDVRLETADVRFGRSSVSLVGQAKTFEALGQQMQLFQKHSLVSSLKLTKVEMLKEGGIQFTVEIFFDKSIFD